MKDYIADILARMRPYIEASGADADIYFVDEDFGIAEVSLAIRPDVSHKDLTSLKHSIAQIILREVPGIRSVEFIDPPPSSTAPHEKRSPQTAVPDLAEEELATLRAGTGLALDILKFLDTLIRNDLDDRILRELRQATHFINGPYPKWSADARDRFEALSKTAPPKTALRSLRDIFPAIDRTARALARVMEAERAAWRVSSVPLKDNTAPMLLREEASGECLDLFRILSEIRPHLGDRALAGIDPPAEEAPEESRPTKHLLDKIFKDAALMDVRDVYIEAGESSALVRYRIGCKIQPVVEFPRALYRSLIARIKHLASLDIKERKRRQEGKISFSESSGYKGLHVQVQTIPDHFAERIHIHLPLTRGSRS